MRIATWNVERLKHRRDLDEIRSLCSMAAADILVLTETDDRLKPDYKHCFQTTSLKGIIVPTQYADAENRVSIYTNYECVQIHSTYDEATAVCVELATESGNLLVYGTIIGIKGNRDPKYKGDLSRQLADIERFRSAGHMVCMAGDFNCSFSDGYYFTKAGRSTMLEAFDENNIEILTAGLPETIDHIAVSSDFIVGKNIRLWEWNEDKRLSDHKGVAVEIE